MATTERFLNLPEQTIPLLRALLALHPSDGDAISVSISAPRHPDTDAPMLPGADVAAKTADKNHVRAALVAPKKETQRGLAQLRDCLYEQGR